MVLRFGSVGSASLPAECQNFDVVLLWMDQWRTVPANWKISS